MNVKPEIGIGKLIFGFKESEVKDIYGNPDEIKKDTESENRIIWVYNKEKIRLTFYESEDRRLGYIETSNRNLSLNDFLIIDSNIEFVKNKFAEKIVNGWKKEEYHSFTTYFNEIFWITLHVEYEEVTNLEIGVPFINDDEYKWPNK